MQAIDIYLRKPHNLKKVSRRFAKSKIIAHHSGNKSTSANTPHHEYDCSHKGDLSFAQEIIEETIRKCLGKLYYFLNCSAIFW